MEIAKKMARENFSIGAFYNITKNQDNQIKTEGQDSFFSKKTLTRMWANAKRDGRPAKHRWRPLFNAAKFG